MEISNSLGDVSGFTLILPSISIANTPQLAVDLITETLDLRIHTEMRHGGLIPFAAWDDKSNALLGEMQAYLSPKDKLVLLQLRSSIDKAKHDDFVRDLLKWIMDHNFGSVLLATSIDAVHCIDKQLEGTPIRAVRTKKLTAVDPLTPLELHPESELPLGLFIPGGGYARKLFLAAEEASLDITLVCIFTSPGDNSEQAALLASAVRTIAGFTIPPSGWHIPATWELLFGTSFGPGLY
eukprot:gene3899-8395_t